MRATGCSSCAPRRHWRRHWRRLRLCNPGKPWYGSLASHGGYRSVPAPPTPATGPVRSLGTSLCGVSAQASALSATKKPLRPLFRFRGRLQQLSRVPSASAVLQSSGGGRRIASVLGKMLSAMLSHAQPCSAMMQGNMDDCMSLGSDPAYALYGNMDGCVEACVCTIPRGTT